MEDEETGLYYNRFRYYDPAQAAYIADDPIRLQGGFQLRGYVEDPWTWVDPLGLNGQGSVPSLAHVLEGHGPGQGFTGVFDAANGRVLRPISSENPLPDVWVRRRGGHAAVSSELGGNRTSHVGFAAIIQNDGTLDLTWRSGQLNSPPDYEVPRDTRSRIAGVVEEATGRKVGRCGK